MYDSAGFYLLISYWYKYTTTYTLLKQKIYFQVTTSPNNKVWQVVVASTVPCTICSLAIFKLFFINAINWKFWYLFLLISLE